MKFVSKTLLVVLLSFRCLYSSEIASNSFKKKSITLITFDVDGTLLHGSSAQAEVSAHARAFMNAAGKTICNDNEYEKKFNTPLHFVPPEKYHGCTDGLIMMNLLKYAFNIPALESFNLLPTLFNGMYKYLSNLSDEQVALGISPLPGVINTLNTLAQQENLQGKKKVFKDKNNKS
jgi:FMN phosphatase YigB (HAD superfamily)